MATVAPHKLTRESVKIYLEARRVSWEARLPAQRPVSFVWPAELNELRRSPRLVDELRRVADEICDVHWLRVYAHKTSEVKAMRNVLDPATPTYHPVKDFVIDGRTEIDAKQELWQRDVGDNLPALALAAKLFGDEKYVAAIKRHVRAACDYPTWGAGSNVVNRDLSCAQLARGFGIVRDWLPGIWSEAELKMIRDKLQSRVGELLLGICGEAYWHDHWRDNHCHVSMTALGICGLVFYHEIPDAPLWLAAAEMGLENVTAIANPDGSSAEGVPYWSYGTSFLLQQIEATRAVTGADRFYDTPYFKNSFSYRLQSSTPALGATLCFGDAVKHDYYGPGFLMRALARHFQNPHMQWLAEQIPFAPIGGADSEAWNVLWNDPTVTPAAPALELDAHFPDWDVAISRSGWRPDDTMLALKCGFANRNHSHLDVGALVFAWGDEWLLTAPGYGIVGPGFWDANGERWTYYSNSTESHNTLLINGVNQKFDPAARGTILLTDVTPAATRIVADLTGAYEGVTSVRREVIHVRGREILIIDDVELPTAGKVEWLLQPGGDVTTENGDVIATGKLGALRAHMVWPSAPFKPSAPTRPHLDVAPASIKTHAVAQQGTKIRFVCRIGIEKK